MRQVLKQSEIEEIKENKWVIFSTCSENMPRCIIVMPSYIDSTKMILSNIQMNKTIKNLKRNSNCFINVYIKDIDKQYKIECNCEIKEDGKIFNEIKNYEESNNLPKELKVRSIIIANFTSINISKE